MKHRKNNIPKKVVDKIRDLAHKNGGAVTPECVVDEAAKSSSPLHRYFTWDDSEAAASWRLHEARNLINATFTVTSVDAAPVKAFISLTTERGKGYRPIEDVLNATVLRDQMVADAYAEMQAFINKYQSLKAVSDVVVFLKERLAEKRSLSSHVRVA